jgi:lysophospholipase L1-like esterase
MASRPLNAKAILLGLCCLAAGGARASHDGDLTGDGAVDAADLLWAMQALGGGRTLDPAQLLRGDVAPLVTGTPQPDGAFGTGDLTLIYRIALGMLDVTPPPWPGNLFNIGDSIGEGEAAQGDIGNPHHEHVWSTGFAGADGVLSLNERFEAGFPLDYYENNTTRDAIFNHAWSGAVMADFEAQAQAVVAAAALTPGGEAGMVTVLLGSNDVCTDSVAGAMTSTATFRTQFMAGLDALAASPATRDARIHVSGIPAIYWLWNAKFSNFWCRVFVWPFVPCQNLLDDPGDDCASSVSRQDPDNDHPGDGLDCQRRKAFHRTIRRDYNSELRSILETYRSSGDLPNAAYIDVYDVPFGSAEVNNGDCFHPSTGGHALLADAEWCRTPWGVINDPQCDN